MQSRAPLMIEHRLIETMISLIKQKIVQIGEASRIDPLMIDTIIDFLKIYADRTHHGKEEEILFCALGKKNMSEQDRQLMDELISEHELGRETTNALVEENLKYRNGDMSALPMIKTKLVLLSDFYPEHIKKEDKIFFPAYGKYFSEQEDLLMLKEFWEFDRKMIHEKYKRVVQAMGQ